MSSHEPSNASGDRDRRELVRAKAAQVHAQQRRGRLIRRSALGIGIAAVVVVAGIGVVSAVRSQQSRPEVAPQNVVDDGFAVTSVSGVAGAPASADDPSPSPTTTKKASASADDATSDKASKKDAATPRPAPTGAGSVDIRVYVDYFAPGAKQFQVANVQQLTRWVSQDAATLTYYPVAMLSAKSNGTKYSQRAASASACVATYAPDAFFAFNNALLGKQPEMGSDGYTDAQLADLAIASGSQTPKKVRSCVEDEAFVPWVKSATERALAGIPDTKGVALTGTPMVLVNGTPYAGALDDPKEFAQFVLTLSSDAYYTTPSPTPSPTASEEPSPSPTSTSTKK